MNVGLITNSSTKTVLFWILNKREQNLFEMDPPTYVCSRWNIKVAERVYSQVNLNFEFLFCRIYMYVFEQFYKIKVIEQNRLKKSEDLS